MLIVGESNVAIDPAIGGYGVADIYLGEFSPHYTRDLATTAALCTCCTQLIRFKHIPKLISLKGFSL